MRYLKIFLTNITLFSITLFKTATAFSQEQAAGQNTLQGAILSDEIDAAKKLVDLFIEFCLNYSFQVIGGIIILILGWLFAKVVTKFAKRLFDSHNIDVTVSKFLLSIIRMIIIAFAALIALGKFGVTIAPFIAGLSVVGFGTSFALQGPLSNYAAGASLIFTKPFKVGDIIEVAGAMGEVQDITLARTMVKALDGTLIVIPNKHIIGDIIHNYSENKKLDITIGVSYGSDVDKAIELMRNIIKNESKVTNKDEIKVGIKEFADSSVNIFARLQVKQNDYWDILFDINRKIKAVFDKEKIIIPFPQRDIHIYEEKK
jgi:small conductance mechanosensitive channel